MFYFSMGFMAANDLVHHAGCVSSTLKVPMTWFPILHHETQFLIEHIRSAHEITQTAGYPAHELVYMGRSKMSLPSSILLFMFKPNYLLC